MFFLEFLCFFKESADVSNLMSGSSAFFKSNLYNWKFYVHVLLKHRLKDCEHYLASMWNACNCGVVWTSFWRRQWHSTPVLLPGKSHGRRSLVGCCPWVHEESDMTERLHFHFSLLCIREGNGNPLQCSCLENPRDGIPQSRTWLKWLSSSSWTFFGIALLWVWDENWPFQVLC